MHSAIVQALAMALGLAATVVSVPTNPMIKVLGTSLSEMVQPVRCKHYLPLVQNAYAKLREQAWSPTWSNQEIPAWLLYSSIHRQ